MTIATSFEQVTNNSPDGAQMGKGVLEKNAFFGSTPVIQPTSANQSAVSATAAAADLTASSTGALTATVPAITYTSNTPTPSNTQTINDGTVPTVAELGQFTADQEDYNLEVKVDLAAQKVVIDKNVVDVAAQKVELDKLITDVASGATLSNQIRSELVTLGLIKGS